MNKEEQPPNPPASPGEAIKEVESKPPISSEQQRAERVMQIDQRLASFSYSAKTEEEITEIQQKREQKFQEKVQELETGLRQPLTEESRTKIHQNMVDSAIERAQRENVEYDHLVDEKTILEYLNKTLSAESEKSFIGRPMDRECKVAVMIPVYNENASTVLRSLSSLVEQEGTTPNSFEVDIVVNNKKKDAKQNSAAFSANQEIIKLIEYINGENQEVPEGLTAEQIKQIEDIRKSQVRINAIDKSSADTANEKNNVGIARNRAGAEISDRFITSSGNTEGIIAITDSDCTFSRNYIKSLIESFEQHRINGVSGNLEFEIDPNLPNQELIQRAFDIYMGKDHPKEDYSGEPNFKVQKEGALRSGANMAVPVRAWARVGGMPPLAGGEDIRFGQSIEKLRGQVAKNYDYTITSLIRVSERTGLQGNGRIVKKIKESVEAFISGESDKILIEDREMVDRFFDGVIKASQEKQLTGRLLIDMMVKNNFKENQLSKAEYDELADEINQELEKPETERDYRKIEKMALEKIYPFYPEKDVTERLGEKK